LHTILELKHGADGRPGRAGRKAVGKRGFAPVPRAWPL